MKVEPILIKAGDTKVLLGHFKVPPKVDCRVISEELYQRLKSAYEQNMQNSPGQS
jgi:hypothetical protein